MRLLMPWLKKLDQMNKASWCFLRLPCFFLFISFFCQFPSYANTDSGKSSSSQHETTEEKKAEQPQEKPASPVKDTVSPPFMRMEPLVIPIIRKEEVVAYLRLIPEIEVIPRQEFSVIQNQIYKLQDAFFTDLYSALNSLWIEKTEPKIETLRKRLQKISDKMFGEGKIKVLIKNYFFDSTATVQG